MMAEKRFPVGVIGLGAMGNPIVRRLLGEGWPVVVHDALEAAAQALVGAGAKPAASPEAVAAEATVVIISLPGESEVREVLLGDRGVAQGASDGTVIVDTSTLRPQASRELGAELLPKKVTYLDAPLSGGPAGALSGSLVVMIGGSAGAVRQVTPPLETLGTIFHCGGLGTGQVCKACNQLVVVGTIELVAEALVLGAAAGLDPSLVRSALMGGYASSRVLELHGARMLRRDFEPGGKARFNLKDLEVIGGLAAGNGLALPAFEAAATQLRHLVDQGGGDLDNSALITVLEGSRTGGV
ncbi:MAG: NAD(P)-dependent oxidoreductase [Acidimicrobiales bacterium]|jgi:2-hydroxy-3-oxopropionate reductase